MLLTYQRVLFLLVIHGFAHASDYSPGSPLSHSDSYSSISSLSLSPGLSPSPTLTRSAATPSRSTKRACTLSMHTPNEVYQTQDVLTGALQRQYAEHGYVFAKERIETVHLADLGTVSGYDEVEVLETFHQLTAFASDAKCGAVCPTLSFDHTDCMQKLRFTDHLITFIGEFIAATQRKEIKGLTFSQSTMPVGIYLGWMRRLPEANTLAELKAKLSAELIVTGCDFTVRDLCLRFQNPADASDR